MKKISSFDYHIEHIDPMGQGVSKNIEAEKISFILKTLPGEAGQVTPYKEKGKLRFAIMNNPSSLKISSPLRIEANCQHYNDCLGCHFLHTDYDNELNFKEQSFHFMSKRLKFSNQDQKIVVIKAKSRNQYRNRIQLHYNKKSRQLGLIKKDSHDILEVSKCLLPLDEIQNKVQELYDNDSWLKLLTKSPNRGHIEISKLPESDKVAIHINQKYSAGGFTQVNHEMNEKLRNFIFKEVQETLPKNSTIVDLFGGNGNLTEKLTDHKVEIYDGTPARLIKVSEHQSYNEIDLYSDKALDKVSNINADLLIVDPPRSGIKNLDQFVNKFKSHKIIYVSCHPATMIRDIQTLQSTHSFKIKSLVLLDLFPSTYHFESLAILEG